MNTMSINVRQFVYDNITPYDGDASFLAGPTERTTKLMEEVKKYLKEERDNNGLRSADPSTISTITSHKPGYIDKDLETIV
jgi:formate C-acetyltransferase